MSAVEKLNIAFCSRSSRWSTSWKAACVAFINIRTFSAFVASAADTVNSSRLASVRYSLCFWKSKTVYLAEQLRASSLLTFLPTSQEADVLRIQCHGSEGGRAGVSGGAYSSCGEFRRWTSHQSGAASVSRMSRSTAAHYRMHITHTKKLFLFSKLADTWEVAHVPV